MPCGDHRGVCLLGLLFLSASVAGVWSVVLGVTCERRLWCRPPPERGALLLEAAHNGETAVPVFLSPGWRADRHASSSWVLLFLSSLLARWRCPCGNCRNWAHFRVAFSGPSRAASTVCWSECLPPELARAPAPHFPGKRVQWWSVRLPAFPFGQGLGPLVPIALVALHRFKTPGVSVGFILFTLHILSRRIGSSSAPSSQLEVPPDECLPYFLPEGRLFMAICFTPQDAVSALLARTSAELLAVEQELAQEDDEEAGPGEELRGPEGDW